MKITSVLTAAALLLASCGVEESASETPSPEPAATESATTAPATTAPTTTSPDPPPPDDVQCVAVTIPTGAVEIRGERCSPAVPPDAPSPAALVLNGCGGYESDSELTSATVRALAERGVIGLRVDWLAAEPAPPDTYCEAGPVIAAVNPLLQGLVDSVDELRSDPAVDADRVGTASYSLGALAMMAAEYGGAGLTEVTPLDLRAAALLSYPNQLPTILELATDQGAPPLFLMTGSDDTTAPPSDSRALATAARAGGATADVVIVDGQDHPWRGDAAERAATALADFLAGALTTVSLPPAAFAGSAVLTSGD